MSSNISYADIHNDLITQIKYYFELENVDCQPKILTDSEINDIIKFTKTNNISPYNINVIKLVRTNNIEFLKKLKFNDNPLMSKYVCYEAAKLNNLNIINLIGSHFVNTKIIICIASEHNHIDIVRHFVDKFNIQLKDYSDRNSRNDYYSETDSESDDYNYDYDDVVHRPGSDDKMRPYFRERPKKRRIHYIESLESGDEDDQYNERTEQKKYVDYENVSIKKHYRYDITFEKLFENQYYDLMLYYLHNGFVCQREDIYSYIVSVFEFHIDLAEELINFEDINKYIAKSVKEENYNLFEFLMSKTNNIGIRDIMSKLNRFEYTTFFNYLKTYSEIDEITKDYVKTLLTYYKNINRYPELKNMLESL